MNENDARKVAKELNEKYHYDFKIRKYKSGTIILSYNGQLGLVHKRQCFDFDHVVSLMNKFVEYGV